MKDIQFEGYDWTELHAIFDLEGEYEDDIETYGLIKGEQIFLSKLKDHIISIPTRLDEEKAKWAIRQLRRFMRALTKGGGYYKSYYNGILKTKHDEVFLGILSQNVECLWT